MIEVVLPVHPVRTLRIVRDRELCHIVNVRERDSGGRTWVTFVRTVWKTDPDERVEEVGVSSAEQSAAKARLSALLCSIRETTEARMRQMLPGIVASICDSTPRMSLNCANTETMPAVGFHGWRFPKE